MPLLDERFYVNEADHISNIEKRANKEWIAKAKKTLKQLNTSVNA